MKTKNQKKFKDQEFLKSLKKLGKRSGVAQTPIDEPIPTYEKGQCETIFRGDNNSFMILGRDRPSHPKSGFGGKGATQCGRIDLLVGLGSGISGGPPNEDTIVNPNFALDAARIYISQRADIDKYMGIAQTPRQSKPGSSAIGLKADAIRIHDRNDIKIVTGRSRVENVGKDGEKLSSGGLNQTVGTISLIAGNYTDAESQGGINFFNPLKKSLQEKSKLQPIPKGDNLAQCLEEIIGVMGELAAQIGTNTSLIGQLNNVSLSSPCRTTSHRTKPSNDCCWSCGYPPNHISNRCKNCIDQQT